MDSRKMIAILVVCLGAIVAIHARSIQIRSSSDDNSNSNSMESPESADDSSESMSTEMPESMCSGSPESSEEDCNPAVTTQASSAAQETVAVAATNAEVVGLMSADSNSMSVDSTDSDSASRCDSEDSSSDEDCNPAVTIEQESAAQETVVGPTNDEISDTTIAVTSDDKDGRR